MIGEPPLRGLSLWQLYAGLVALEIKTIETRKTRTSHRGPLVICAARTYDEDAHARLYDRLVSVERRLTPSQHERYCRVHMVAVAVVDVVDCRPLVPEDEPRSLFYAPNRWAWVLDRVRPLERFVHVRGMPGLFPIPTLARRSIEAQVGGL